MTSAPSFRLLPVEATEAMLDAPLRDYGEVTAYGATYSGKFYESGRDLRPEIWRAMVSAAPVMAEATGTVVDEIAAERRRQTEAEGWTAEHDDAHTDGSMARAAATYALAAAAPNADRAVLDQFGNDGLTYEIKCMWPASWSFEWLKPKDRRRDLVRAGALILAEIERLDRKSALNAALAIPAGQLGEKESGDG